MVMENPEFWTVRCLAGKNSLYDTLLANAEPMLLCPFFTFEANSFLT